MPRVLVYRLRDEFDWVLFGLVVVISVIGVVNLFSTGRASGSPELYLTQIYWLVFGAIGEGSYAWEYAEGNGFSGPGSFGNFNYSLDQGANWIAPGSENLFKIAVNVSPVPVPGAAVLFGAAVGGLLGASRRRGPVPQTARAALEQSDLA